MKKNIYLYKIKVLKQDNTYNSEFEKRILNLIYSCSSYMDFEYIDKEKLSKYKLLKAEREENSKYYFSVIKKSSHLTTTQLDDTTEKVSTSKVENDNFIRFGIDLNSNLMAIITKGHFGIDQFTVAFKYIFSEALKREFKENIGIIEFSIVPGIPNSWNPQNLMEKVKQLNYLKEIKMEFFENNDSKESIDIEISEKRELKNISTRSFQFSELERTFNYYINKNNNFFEFECKDINGQNYVISKIKNLKYSYNLDLSEKINFIPKAKDSIEDYIKNYLNK